MTARDRHYFFIPVKSPIGNVITGNGPITIRYRPLPVHDRAAGNARNDCAVMHGNCR